MYNLLHRRNTTVNNNTQLETFCESMAPAVDDHTIKQARKVFYHVSRTLFHDSIFSQTHVFSPGWDIKGWPSGVLLHTT